MIIYNNFNGLINLFCGFGKSLIIYNVLLYNIFYKKEDKFNNILICFSSLDLL